MYFRVGNNNSTSHHPVVDHFTLTACPQVICSLLIKLKINRTQYISTTTPTTTILFYSHTVYLAFSKLSRLLANRWVCKLTLRQRSVQGVGMLSDLG